MPIIFAAMQKVKIATAIIEGDYAAALVLF